MPVTVDEVRDILFIPIVVPLILASFLIICLLSDTYRRFRKKTLTKKSILSDLLFIAFFIWSGWQATNRHITDYINAQVHVTVGYVENSSHTGALHRSIRVEGYRNYRFAQFSGYPEVRSGITYRIYYTPITRTIIRAVPIN